MLIRCVALFALLATSPLAATSLGLLDEGATPPPLIVCTGEYALCASASCQPIPRYEVDALREGLFQVESTKALCQCENRNGVNVAQVPCQFRGDGAEQMRVSTYSWADAAPAPGPNHQLMHCAGTSKFTNCLNAPCQVDPLDPSKSVCTCPMTSTGDANESWVTFGASCNALACATTLWSGATQTAIDQAECCIDEYLESERGGQSYTCAGGATSGCKTNYQMCP